MKRIAGTTIAHEKTKRPRLYAQSEEVHKALYVKVTTEGELIYPRDQKKYYGSHTKTTHPTLPWLVSFQGLYTKGKEFSQTRYQTEEAAIAHIKGVNISEGWPIRNIIYKHGDAYYVCLTQQILMKFSPMHMDLVESYTWHAFSRKNTLKDCHYARTSMSQKGKKKEEGPATQTFHRMMYPEVEEEIEPHINGNTLDNTVENVRHPLSLLLPY